jgi:C2H2 type zinc finger protein
MAVDKVDLLTMAESTLPLSQIAESSVDTNAWGSNVFPTGPQMSFDERLIQPVGGMVMTPINAASVFHHGGTQFRDLPQEGLAGFALSMTMDIGQVSQDGTQVYDSTDMSSTDDSGPGNADSKAKPRSICPACGKSYSRPASLTRHVNSEHRSIRHQCSQCLKTYDRPEYVRRHEKSAHGKTSRTPYPPGPRTPQASASPRSTGVSKTRGRKAQQNSSLAKKIERIREKYSLEIQRAIFEDMSQTFDLSGEDMDGLGEE